VLVLVTKTAPSGWLVVGAFDDFCEQQPSAAGNSKRRSSGGGGGAAGWCVVIF